MSTPLEDQAELAPAIGPDRGRRLALAARISALLSSLGALSALWSVERVQVAHDLQLAAEPRARPGEILALRGFLFRDLDAPEGASLVRAPARVRLLDERERELVRTPLSASELDTLDGWLALPATRSGRFTLEARSAYQGSELACRRALSVEPHPPAAAARGREAGPLQQFAAGRVRVLGAAPAPEPLLARVVGGACIPEQRCRLLVWVGDPPASVSLRADAALRADAVPTAETAGIVGFDVIVRGLDAQVTIEARRAGALVAERTLRLPIGLGEVGVYAPRSIVERADVALGYALPPGRARAIVDLFVAGRWRATRVLSGTDEAAAGEAAPRASEGGAAARSDELGAAEGLPGQPPLGSSVAIQATLDEALLPAGLVRVQARVDRFSSEGAGARALYVRAPGEGDLEALSEIARQVAAEAPDPDPATAAWANALPSFAGADVQQTAAFLLAALEQQRFAVPQPVSGRPAQLRRLERTRVRMRFGVAGAVALSALVVALSIARRGLSAAAQAQAILDAARGEPSVSARKELLRARAGVLLLVLAVAAAFLAGALLIASKPLWF